MSINTENAFTAVFLLSMKAERGPTSPWMAILLTASTAIATDMVSKSDCFQLLAIFPNKLENTAMAQNNMKLATSNFPLSPAELV